MWLLAEAADLGCYSLVLYLLFACIAVVCLCLQLAYLTKLFVLPVVLLPLLSVCVAYENVILYYYIACYGNCSIIPAIGASAFVCHSLQIPLFIVVAWEIAFALHESRSAHFFCFALDQAEDGIVTNTPAIVCMWLVRLMACGLFIINILVDTSSTSYNDDAAALAGSGGYAYLASNHFRKNSTLWLALIPPITLSGFALAIGIVIYRYGKYLSIGLDNKLSFKIFLIFSLAICVGYCFDSNVFPITSNAGELAYLIGLTFLLYVVQNELSLAASYADFLHRSNVAFRSIPKNTEQRSEVVSEFIRRSLAAGGSSNGSEASHNTRSIPTSTTILDSGKSIDGRSIELTPLSEDDVTLEIV